MRCLPYGDRAVLLEVEHTDQVLTLHDAVLALAHPAISSVVPAARTVLVEFDPSRMSAEDLVSRIEVGGDTTTASPDLDTAVVELPVTYDGADLGAVADASAMTVEAVIQRHTQATYRVQFCGFAPGFAYLTGLDPALHLPRLASPRASVPAGSVAIAGEYTGVYPRSSPGGWRLLGRTHERLFDLASDRPALLVPGMFVKFIRSA